MDRLGTNIYQLILQYVQDLEAISGVNKFWHHVVQSETVWKLIRNDWGPRMIERPVPLTPLDRVQLGIAQRGSLLDFHEELKLLQPPTNAFQVDVYIATYEGTMITVLSPHIAPSKMTYITRHVDNAHPVLLEPTFYHVKYTVQQALRKWSWSLATLATLLLWLQVTVPLLIEGLVDPQHLYIATPVCLHAIFLFLWRKNHFYRTLAVLEVGLALVVGLVNIGVLPWLFIALYVQLVGLAGIHWRVKAYRPVAFGYALAQYVLFWIRVFITASLWFFWLMPGYAVLFGSSIACLLEALLPQPAFSRRLLLHACMTLSTLTLAAGLAIAYVDGLLPSFWPISIALIPLWFSFAAYVMIERRAIVLRLMEALFYMKYI